MTDFILLCPFGISRSFVESESWDIDKKKKKQQKKQQQQKKTKKNVGTLVSFFVFFF